MSNECDNRSVGVVITNERQQLALLKRGRFPIGMAPPAGHIDDHGSVEQAGVDEVFEEVGIELVLGGLKQTVIEDRRVDNVCRRVNGDHHIWWVREAHVTNPVMRPDPVETGGAGWYDEDAVQQFADRTKAYQAGSVSEDDWAENPGLEPVWLDFLTELGYVE